MERENIRIYATTMPRQFFKKFSPSADTIKEQKCLGFLGKHLHSPMLWHLNRRSVSMAFAVGLFMMWIPFPPQMLFAALLAILLCANLPISVALVWITNPITIPPMFYFAYKVGALILGHQPVPMKFELTWEWLTTSLALSWQPFLLGLFIVAVISSALGYFGIQLLWRIHIMRRFNARKLRRQKQEKIDD